MLGQYLVVALIVIGCAAYRELDADARRAAPAQRARRSAACPGRAPSRAGWPSRRRRRRAAGCDGCERSTLAVPKARRGAPTPITFHRRPPKRD